MKLQRPPDPMPGDLVKKRHFAWRPHYRNPDGKGVWLEFYWTIYRISSSGTSWYEAMLFRGEEYDADRRKIVCKSSLERALDKATNGDVK